MKSLSMRLHLTAARRVFTAMAFAASLSTATAGTIVGHVVTQGAKDNANAVVYIERIAGATFAPPSTNPVMDQMRKCFVPHVLPIVKGTTVEFLNSDPWLHNVYALLNGTTLFNWAMPMQGMKLKYTFRETGDIVLLCNVHPEMSAHIIVVETPYFATTTKDGAFEIRNVPAGQYTVHIWHQKRKVDPQVVNVRNADIVAVNFTL